jgi:hypothetical protein
MNGTKRAAVIVITKMKFVETSAVTSEVYLWELFFSLLNPLIITTTPPKDIKQKIKSFLFIYSCSMIYDKTKVAIGAKFLVID